MTIARPLPAGFADLATPDQVAEDFARSLAALLCRGLGHPASAASSCADCLAAGRALAPSVGRALLWVRRVPRSGRRGRLRPMTLADYDVVGELLEGLAAGSPAGPPVGAILSPPPPR